VFNKRAVKKSPFLLKFPTPLNIEVRNYYVEDFFDSSPPSIGAMNDKHMVLLEKVVRLDEGFEAT
jgi:hypothetical protein